MIRSIVKKVKFLIPILILLAGVGFVVAFEFFIKDKIDTVEVVVASENIEFKQRITENDLVVKQVKKNNLVEQSYQPKDVERIIGEFASINIKKGTQLYPELIDSYDLVPDESKGEFIAPIPNKWLYAVPGSLRRSYIADIYVVGNEETALLESLINDSKDYENEKKPESDDEKESNDKQDEGDDQSQEQVEKVETKVVEANEQKDHIVKSMAEPILTNVRVSSVKDSGNKEVTQAKESNSPESATGNVSQLEIIATGDMLQTIQEKTSTGYKLYIVYKYERNKQNDEEGSGE